MWNAGRRPKPLACTGCFQISLRVLAESVFVEASAPHEEMTGNVVGQDDGITRGADEPNPAGTDTQLHLGTSRDRRILEGGDELGIGLDRLADAADDSGRGLTTGKPFRTDLIGGGTGVLSRLRRDGVTEGIGGDVVKDAGQASLDLLTHHVLPTACLLMDGPAVQADDVQEQPFSKPVLADHFSGPPARP